MGSESRSMKETVPVPLPEVMAWVALLLCVLCCFPSAQAFGAGLSPTARSPSLRPCAAWVSALEAQAWFQPDFPGTEVQCTACWQQLV